MAAPAIEAVAFFGVVGEEVWFFRSVAVGAGLWEWAGVWAFGRLAGGAEFHCGHPLVDRMGDGTILQIRLSTYLHVMPTSCYHGMVFFSVGGV